MYNRNKINPNSWSNIKKLLAFITGILLWIVSLVFSYNGFGISNNDVAWAGAVLAFAVTVLELIFNTNTMGKLLNNDAEFGEWILVIGGVVAYVYDIWTNILGFYVMQNRPAPTVIDISFIVPFLFGCMVAILPEPMFVWAMGWNKSNPSDFVDHPKPRVHQHTMTPSQPVGGFANLTMSQDLLDKLRKSTHVKNDEHRS